MMRRVLSLIVRLRLVTQKLLLKSEHWKSEGQGYCGDFRELYQDRLDSVTIHALQVALNKVPTR